MSYAARKGASTSRLKPGSQPPASLNLKRQLVAQIVESSFYFSDSVEPKVSARVCVRRSSKAWLTSQTCRTKFASRPPCCCRLAAAPLRRHRSLSLERIHSAGVERPVPPSPNGRPVRLARTLRRFGFSDTASSSCRPRWCCRCLPCPRCLRETDNCPWAEEGGVTSCAIQLNPASRGRHA